MKVAGIACWDFASMRMIFGVGNKEKTKNCQ
jgi:hypothetical protein